jgi:hypothetical protein
VFCSPAYDERRDEQSRKVKAETMIRRVRDFWVFASVLRQLGVLPASAAA